MNVRDKKGSITIFVLVGLLFMSSFLIITYGSNLNKSKTLKEQHSIIQDTYSNHDNDADAYNTVYEALRNKNKKELIASVNNADTIRINNAFDGRVINYQIYAIPDRDLGKDIDGDGKVEIQLFVTHEIDIPGSVGTISDSYEIELPYSLMVGEYIDYKTQSIRATDGTVKKYINIPTIYTYENYTHIEVDGGYHNPAKIIIEYIGYEINN